MSTRLFTAVRDGEVDAQTLVDQFSNSRLVPVFFVIGVLLMPFVFVPGLAIEIMILGIFAMSFNVLFGFTGLFSFGHALFFGSGAYIAGYISITAGYPLLVVLAIVILIEIVLALIVGALSLQVSDIYFAIITLAFAQFAYEMSFILSEYTGGSDGMIGITRAEPLGMGLIDMTDTLVFAYVSAFFLIVLGLFIYLLSNSLFGRTLKSIKENEARTKTLGVDTYRVKIVAFVVAGIIAAIAGVLWSMYLRFVDPSVLFWIRSGDAVLDTVVGGMNSVFGPLFGTALLVTIDDQLFATSPGRLSVVLGSILIVIMLFARGGVISILKAAVARAVALVMRVRS